MMYLVSRCFLTNLYFFLDHYWAVSNDGRRRWCWCWCCCCYISLFTLGLSWSYGTRQAPTRCCTYIWSTTTRPWMLRRCSWTICWLLCWRKPARLFKSRQLRAFERPAELSSSRSSSLTQWLERRLAASKRPGLVLCSPTHSHTHTQQELQQPFLNNSSRSSSSKST